MNKICIVLLGFLAYISLYSCDEPTLVGQDLIPEDDALELDSIELNSFVFNMYRDDSIYNSSVSEFRLGKYMKSGFANSVANFYGEVYFPGTMTRLDNAVFDSLVLYLNTSGFEGDSTVVQTIEVYELVDTLKSQTEGSYYMRDSIAVSNLLGQFTDVLYTSDSSYVTGILTSSHLKTHLDPVFGADLFQQLNDSLITNNREFQDYFNGLGIKANNSSSGAGWFQINNQASNTALTGLALHYHNADDTVTLKLPLTSLFDYIDEDDKYFPGSQNINQIQTLYADVDILNQLNNYSSTGNLVNTIASGNGIYLSLELDNLMSQLGANDVVNFAELTIKPNLTNLADTLLLPQTLIMGDSFVTNDEGYKTGSVYGIDGTNVTGTITNGRIFDNTQYGYLERIAVGEYQYRFQIPGTIQSMHQDIIPPVVFILPTGRATTFTNFSFDTNNVSLKLIYSKK